MNPTEILCLKYTKYYVERVFLINKKFFHVIQFFLREVVKIRIFKNIIITIIIVVDSYWS